MSGNLLADHDVMIWAEYLYPSTSSTPVCLFISPHFLIITNHVHFIGKPLLYCSIMFFCLADVSIWDEHLHPSTPFTPALNLQHAGAQRVCLHRQAVHHGTLQRGTP